LYPSYYLLTCAADLDLDSQAVDVYFFFFANYFETTELRKGTNVAFDSHCFPSPEGRDSPVCDVDAGVHGHHLQFLLLLVFVIRIVADSF